MEARIKAALYMLVILSGLTGFSACGHMPKKNSSESDASREQIQNSNAQDPDMRNIGHLQQLFQEKAIEEIACRINYPLKRESPIPDVQNATELKRRFDEIFDPYLIGIIANSNIDQWSKVGWRGIMLDDGILWVDTEAKITAVNYQGEYEKELARKLTNEEKSKLYPALQPDFERTYLKFETKNYSVRIDKLLDGTYRYTCWKKESPESTKPDLILGNGVFHYEGNGGNEVITFINGNYKYKVFRNVLASQGTPEVSLVVEKGGREILSEGGKPEDSLPQSELAGPHGQ